MILDKLSSGSTNMLNLSLEVAQVLNPSPSSSFTRGVRGSRGLGIIRTSLEVSKEVIVSRGDAYMKEGEDMSLLASKSHNRV